MPIGSPIAPRAKLPHGEGIVQPVQMINPWVDVIDAGSLDTAQGTPILDPDVDIIGDALANLHHILNTIHQGTTLRVRMAYDRATSAVVSDCVIQAFGRYEAGVDEWMRLADKAGNYTHTLTIDLTNDTDDGSVFNYTEAHPSILAWDLDGCAQVLFGVNAALNTNGNDALAKLQAKII